MASEAAAGASLSGAGAICGLLFVTDGHMSCDTLVDSAGRCQSHAMQHHRVDRMHNDFEGECSSSCI